MFNRNYAADFGDTSLQINAYKWSVFRSLELFQRTLTNVIVRT
jgi:hypothetical protein